MSKTKKAPLPFPQLVDLGDHACCQCGYPLEGIPAPGDCPECGLGFEEGISALLIHGVMKKSGGPGWRRAVWVVIAVIAYLYFQVAFIFVWTHPLITLAGFVGVVFAIVAMVVTNQQRSSGMQVIAFSRQGISYWPLGQSKDVEGETKEDRVFEPWRGVRRQASIKRVSSVWSTLKIRSIDEQGKQSTDLSTGFRCKSDQVIIIRQVIERLAEGSGFDDLEDVDQLMEFQNEIRSDYGFYVSDDEPGSQ